MRIIFPTAPASAIAAGVVAASITFTTMSYASSATIGATSMATCAAGFLAGRGVNLVFGPVSGFIAEQTTRELGEQLLTPVVRTGSRQVAYLTSAAVGTAVIVLSTVLVHASTWIYGKGHTAVCQYLKQTPVEVVSNLLEIGDDTMLLTVDGVVTRDDPLPV
jgi:hypothetical protein